MGLLIMKICCGKSSFDTLGCNRPSPRLVEVAFILMTRVLDFIIGEEGKNGGQCCFLCKKFTIHLDNDLQQL
jgi:hypothetical protein